MTTPDPYDCGDAIHRGMTCDEFDASLEEAAESGASMDVTLPEPPPLWVLDSSDGPQ